MNIQCNEWHNVFLRTFIYMPVMILFIIFYKDKMVLLYLHSLKTSNLNETQFII